MNQRSPSNSPKQEQRQRKTLSLFTGVLKNENASQNDYLFVIKLFKENLLLLRYHVVMYFKELKRVTWFSISLLIKL